MFTILFCYHNVSFAKSNIQYASKEFKINLDTFATRFQGNGRKLLVPSPREIPKEIVVQAGRRSTTTTVGAIRLIKGHILLWPWGQFHV